MHPTVPFAGGKKGTNGRAEMKRKAARRRSNGSSSSLTVNNEGREGKGVWEEEILHEKRLEVA